MFPTRRTRPCCANRPRRRLESPATERCALPARRGEGVPRRAGVPSRSHPTRLSDRQWKDVRTALRERGLLLSHDRALPSVTQVVAGGNVHGSWWSHTKAGAIYDCLVRLGAEDVLSARLIAGKWTYVDERLAGAVDAVAVARDEWQTAGLPAAARRLLLRIDAGAKIRTDDEADRDARRAVAAAVTDLERRLLVQTTQVHTEQGHHARVVGPWRVRDGSPAMSSSAARGLIEEAVRAIEADVGRAMKLPWTRSAGR